MVDADLTFEMDDREIPAGWPYGIYSLGAERPGIKGAAPGSSGMVWKLDPGLADWAYGVSRDVPWPTARWCRPPAPVIASEAEAVRPPRVFVGDVLGTTRGSARRAAHPVGARLGQAVDRRPGRSPVTDCEDQGSWTCSSSSRARAGRI